MPLDHGLGRSAAPGSPVNGADIAHPPCGALTFSRLQVCVCWVWGGGGDCRMLLLVVLMVLVRMNVTPD